MAWGGRPQQAGLDRAQSKAPTCSNSDSKLAARFNWSWRGSGRAEPRRAGRVATLAFSQRACRLQAKASSDQLHKAARPTHPGVRPFVLRHCPPRCSGPSTHHLAVPAVVVHWRTSGPVSGGAAARGPPVPGRAAPAELSWRPRARGVCRNTSATRAVAAIAQRAMLSTTGLAVWRRGGGGEQLQRHRLHAAAHVLVTCGDLLAGKAGSSMSPFSTRNDMSSDQVKEDSTQRVSLAKSLAYFPDDMLGPVERRGSWSKVEESEWCSSHGYMNCASRNNAEEAGLAARPVSLAKSLACLPNESDIRGKKKERTRMELKRAIELRIKKRVKEQNLNGKFYHLMEKVVANSATLRDAYDMIRLNANIELSSEVSDLCFVSLEQELRNGNFDFRANTFLYPAKGRRKQSLVLPNLKLRVIQEAIRVVLEVVYRPHFSKISHGCRSGRGHQSALRYICQEMGKVDWWFTFHMKKRLDENILSKLISTMEKNIEDTQLFNMIHCMYDAKVINLEFGGFPKGQGLPQEGVLSPILMNIYLDNLDSEIFRMFMRYEALGEESGSSENEGRSKLRNWFRRQLKDNKKEDTQGDPNLRLHACRYMDEIFIAVLGSRDIALCLKNEIEHYIQGSLCIQVDDRTCIKEANKSSSGVQFLGVTIGISIREYEAARTVHKLKDKVRLFAAQKQDIWDAAMVRIGRKWLAHGLKKVKESEIRHLKLNDPLLHKISQFRKEGMKTEHWFKSLMKIWLQDVNAKSENNEEEVLCKFLAEAALPQDLHDSFYKFQKCAEKYIISEEASTLALLPDPSCGTGFESLVTKVEAPIYLIQKKLLCYGLVNAKGFPRHVSALIFQDDMFIVHWFSGLIRRWLNWYSEHENFRDIKLLLVEYVKKSCIKTLAAKHRMHESLVEKKFEMELNHIPLTEDIETDMAAIESNSTSYEHDESLTYGIFNSGLCMLLLESIEIPSHISICSVMGCTVKCISVYTLFVKEEQKFPGWKTGFSTAIHHCLNQERIALCNQHIKDLYLGHISLQSIVFGAWRT